MAAATWAMGVPASIRRHSRSSTLGGQRSITVTHEDLREVVLDSTPAHLLPEVFALVDPYRVTNVRERNN